MLYTRNMGYGPRLRPSTCMSLRRLAWAMDIPMSITLENIMKSIPRLIESKVICNACQDGSVCDECYFNPNKKPALPKSKLIAHLKRYFPEPVIPKQKYKNYKSE